MAANHRVLSQLQTVLVQPPDRVVPTMDLVLETFPSRVTFGYYLPLELWGSSVGEQILESNAAAVENARNLPNVIGLSSYEDTSIDGYIAHYVTLYVTSDTGNSTGQLDVRLDALASSSFPATVADFVGKLNATEAA